MVPQPKRSFSQAPRPAQPPQVAKLQTPPRSQSPQPGPLCSVAKKTFAATMAAQVWPAGRSAATSTAEAQTWKSAAHRSAAAQPVPGTLVLLLPETSPQAAAAPMPATLQPPSQAAMRRKVVWLAKLSRVPSEQPMLGRHAPALLQYWLLAQSVSTLQGPQVSPRQI